MAHMEFYPTHIPVPQEKRTSRLWLRPMRATDAALDFEAVISSAAMLRRWSQSDWPADDFTLAQNLADLQRHEREHLELLEAAGLERRLAYTSADGRPWWVFVWTVLRSSVQQPGSMARDDVAKLVGRQPNESDEHNPKGERR